MDIHTVSQIMGALYGFRMPILITSMQLLLMMTITSLQYMASETILTTLLPDVFSFTSGMTASTVLFVHQHCTAWRVSG